MDERPVGIFDSGFGGVSVLREAVRLLNKENYIYFGDNANAPYGDKNEEEIASLALTCADFLMQRGIKAMLLACNTATGTAIRAIRERLSIPVVSIEPAIKPASEASDGTVLMLATRATTEMERYKKLKSRMRNPERIIDVPCHGLVERIESGVFGILEYDDILDKLIGRYKGRKIDGLVLGCTHYVFIKDAIKQYVDKSFTGKRIFYDGNEATVKQLKRVLNANGLENDNGSANVTFFSSAEMNRVEPLFDMLLKTGGPLI
ncbi:MAG: glutamate racemase [Clostridia bacterium]